MKPIAWARVHPDGTYTNEFLADGAIEDVRKTSGAWVPLYGPPDEKMVAEVMDGNVTDREYCAWQMGYGAGVEFMAGIVPDERIEELERIHKRTDHATERKSFEHYMSTAGLSYGKRHEDGDYDDGVDARWRTWLERADMENRRYPK